MIHRVYDPKQPYRHVSYLRMSGDEQNPRSPDQQRNDIEETIQACGYPWILVKAYRDDAITGRYVRKRPAFQQMLRDIETGVVQAEIITVDNRERLGRAEELAFLRHKLLTEYGMFVVTADTRFADPTGPAGKALTFVEDNRSTESNRIKSLEVSRGKKDCARLKRWPGGPPPFGFTLKHHTYEWKGKPHVYAVLDPIPEERTVMQLTFAKARETGWGDARMTKWFNSNPDIPAEFKDISEFTMGYRLENPIYKGVLRWGVLATDIVNDARVIEANPADKVIWVENYCEPCVLPEEFDGLQDQRATRRRSSNHSGDDAAADRLVQPLSRGLTLKYPLTGLVHCGTCGARLRPSPSGRQSKAGRRYVYYPMLRTS